MTRSDTVTALKTWGANRPILEDDELVPLLGAYQAGLAATAELNDELDGRARRRLRRVVAAGDEAVEAILGSFWRLALRQAREANTAGGGPEVIEEKVADAAEAICSAAAGFDVTGGGSPRAFISAAIRNAVAEGERDGDRSWERVGRMARGVYGELATTLGRDPSRAELKDAVRDHALSWAMGRGDGQDSREDARKRLVKQGTWAAIDNLDAVLAATEDTKSIDAGEDGHRALDHLSGGAVPGEGAGVEASVAAEAFLATLTSLERFVVERALGLYDDQEWTWTSIADALGWAWPDVRRCCSDAVHRFVAPHAQFVLTDPHLVAIDVTALETTEAGAGIDCGELASVGEAIEQPAAIAIPGAELSPLAGALAAVAVAV